MTALTTLSNLAKHPSLEQVLPATLLTKMVAVSDIPFGHFCLDSRKVGKHSAFVLLKSAVNHDDQKSIGYAQQAATQCTFILSEIDLSSSQLNTAWVHLPTIRQILGDLQRTLLQTQQPAALSPVLAVTGTNGKTSTASLATQLLAQQHTVALMGTAGNGIYPTLLPATHTTSDVLSLHQSMYDFAQAGATMLCLEASSHGLHQKRLQGLPIKVAVFTNLSRDHLDYHPSMQAYAEAKALLFSPSEFPALSHAIINADDAYADTMCHSLQNHKSPTTTLWRYSLKDSSADFFVRDYQAHIAGVNITLNTPFGTLKLESPLLGAFNISNLVAAIASALALGTAFDTVAAQVKNLQGATGRMQATLKQGVSYIVDYAHTPDAISQAIHSLRLHAQNNNTNDNPAKLHIVFGCGGDRDKGKRPLMMQAALAADNIIVTADNPRSEEPLAIISDMTANLTTAQKAHVHIEADRKKAIALAVNTANTGDMVLIAGKGHETYQEIKGIRHDFDDMAVLQSLLSIG